MSGGQSVATDLASPTRLSRALVITLLLLSLPALAVYVRELFVSYGIYDEGLALYGAQRVLEGDVPYRDFWTIYGPAQFYALAGLFQLFGSSIAVERVWSAAAVAANIVGVGLLLRGSTHRAIAGALLAAVWLAGSPMPGSPMPVALAFALLSLALLERGRARPSLPAIASAGCLAGIASLFRHDLGATLLVVQGIWLFAVRGREARKLREPAAYLLGWVGTTLPAAALLVSNVPVGTLLDQLVLFPAQVFPAYRRLPWPALDIQGLRFYCAPVLLALGTLRALLIWRSGRPLDPTWCCALMLGLLCLRQASVRSDVNHMLPSMLLAIVVSCRMLADLASHPQRLGRALKLTSTLALAALLAGMSPSFASPWRELRHPTRAEGPSSLPRAAGIRVPASKQRYEEVVRFVRDRVPAGEPIFVGNARHDRLHYNDIIFYFLAERDSATAFHELHPGAATSRRVQEQIVRDLAGVNTLILANIASEEDNLSSRGSGSRVLDDYIRAHFEQVHQAAGYRVLARR